MGRGGSAKRNYSFRVAFFLLAAFFAGFFAAGFLFAGAFFFAALAIGNGCRRLARRMFYR